MLQVVLPIYWVVHHQGQQQTQILAQKKGCESWISMIYLHVIRQNLTIFLLLLKVQFVLLYF